MGRLTLMLGLLCATTYYANALPYSKIQDGSLGERYTQKRSSSSSSSFNEANEGKVEYEGTQNGRAFTSTQTSGYHKNGGSHSQSWSSSSVSGGIPVGLASSFAENKFGYVDLKNSGAASGYNGNAQQASSGHLQASNAGQLHSKQSGNEQAGALQFWWMGDNSPFRVQPAGGCTSNGCLASGTFESSNGQLAAGAAGGAFGNGVNHVEIAFQQNPFLNSVSSSSLSTSNSGSSDLANSAANSHNAISGNSKNPFLQGSSVIVAGSKFGANSGEVLNNNAVPASNPLFNSIPVGFSNNHHNIAPITNQEAAHNDFHGYSNGKPNHVANINEREIHCQGEDKICVLKHLCSNDGYFFNQALAQHRSGTCRANQEVCCTLRSPDQAPAGTSTNGGIFGNSNNDLSTGEHNNAFGSENGYLPPIGGVGTSNVPSILNPPQDEEGGVDGPEAIAIVPPAPAPPVQVGCAAALICVEEQFCTLGGVITREPVAFTSEQILRRVPLSDCKNPDTGLIGKCCRDPDYVDPWPAGNLPANYTGGFDQRGFPTGLNYKILKPAAPPTSRPITKGSEPVLGGVSTNAQPHQVPPSYGPVGKSQVAYPKFTKSNPQSNDNTYDAAASKPNYAFIAPHTPGLQCGRRNKVNRPNGLSEVDVAFGEIPWQAMILSKTYKKLLCSGAIVGKSAIVTAASCVRGLKASEIAIKTGEWKLGYELKHEEPLPFEIIDVASVGQYPGDNSIAILFLAHEIAYDQHVDSICLPPVRFERPQAGRTCIATGWGKTVLQVNNVGALMHSIDVDVLSRQECEQRIAGAESQIPIDNLICGKAHNQYNNMCQADFGGPLACQREDGFYELAGLYHQDTGCSPTNQVATFAAVPTEWLEEAIAHPDKYSIDEHQSPSNVQFNVGVKDGGYLPPL